MKKLVALLAGALMMMATSAMALPTLDPGYSWATTPFWNFTDLTTNLGGNSDFSITMENAGYESDFGFYNVNNLLEPTEVTTKFKVFNHTDEKNKQVTVNLKTVAGQLQIGLANPSGQTTNWVNFDKTFGFYFDVHTGGSADTTADYSYYTLNSLSTPKPDAQSFNHILVAYNPYLVKTKIYLDDQIRNPDSDWNDMVVNANDVAPVPEPGTMVLLGFGMLGLAIYGKRRMNKEA